jgi:hypothetical protein
MFCVITSFGQGSELVNVTYSGDTIIATRLSTLDHYLFQADLSPRTINDPSSNVEDTSLSSSSSSSRQYLDPIPIDKSAVSKWGGMDKLERYPGKARHIQVAKNHKSKSTTLVDGNLMMFDGYFSFLWIPTRQHVFFSRPHPELVLNLLRDSISEKDEIENMKNHLSKCYKKDIDEAFIFRPSTRAPVTAADVACSKADYGAGNKNGGGFVEPFRRISRHSDLQAQQEEILIVSELYKNLSSEMKLLFEEEMDVNAQTVFENICQIININNSRAKLKQAFAKDEIDFSVL